MTPRPTHTQELTRPNFAADDRGAIMVMGIFMCTLLVGALWYIAGIGDALIFQERMHEAADSVVFSAAVIEARGMNIVVLINLIMAAILAIRVAINMIKLVCTVLAVVFNIIAAIPFCEWAEIPAGIAEGGAEAMEDADSDTYDAINEAIEALNTAWNGIATGIIAAELGAVEEMANNYAPPVQLPAVPLGKTTTSGLPVTADSTTKLCTEAASAVGSLIGDIAGSAVGGIVSGAMSALAGADPSYFCELPGSSSTPPDVSSAGCSQGNSQTCQQAQAATTDYNNLVAEDAGTAQIQAAQDKMNSLNNSCSNPPSASNGQSCQSAAQGRKADSTTQSGSSDGMNPAMVNSDWYNGTQDAQIVAILYSTGSSKLNVSPGFVNVAQGFNSPGHTKVQMSGPSAVGGQLMSWAQAEFFYDQPGDWSSLSPNAMWNFYWRARFRLTNPGAVTGGDAILALNAPYTGAIASDVGTSFGKWNILNVQTKVSLLSAVFSEQLALH